MIKVTGVKGVMDKIRREVSEKKSEALEKTKLSLVESLKEATPVDTGNARDSWKVTPEGIVNDAPYIPELNEGSSAQAPAYFIEKTVLAHPNVVPNGTIVRYD